MTTSAEREAPDADFSDLSSAIADTFAMDLVRQHGGLARAFAAVQATERERLRQQIEDAEIALNTWDSAHDSEYWLRYPRDPGDLIEVVK